MKSCKWKVTSSNPPWVLTYKRKHSKILKKKHDYIRDNINILLPNNFYKKTESNNVFLQIQSIYSHFWSRIQHLICILKFFLTHGCQSYHFINVLPVSFSGFTISVFIPPFSFINCCMGDSPC